jgi:hypothetical protein
MKKTASFVFIFTLLLLGCGSRIYYLEGAKYDNKESFISARVAMNIHCTESISPIPTPLVKRKLIAMIPTQEAVYKNRLSIAKAISSPVTIDNFRDSPLISAVNENYRLMVERINRKNIYISVELVEYETLSSPQASTDSDIFYIVLTEAIAGKDMLYLTTQKNGKQIVNYDTSIPKCESIRDSYLSSIQTIALQ